MADEMMNINVVIGDRPYRLKINQDEEDIVHKMAKIINDKIKEYQQVFSSKDKQDFLAMIALQNGVEAYKSGGYGKPSGDTHISSKLEQLEELLDQALAK